MPLFNVRLTVVEVYQADDAAQAISLMEADLRRVGFERYDDPACPADAFESEALPPGCYRSQGR